MTKEDIDILWNKALRESIEAGEQFTRYRFAELVIEECAKVCEEHWEIDGAHTAKEFADAIRARGNT